MTVAFFGHPIPFSAPPPVPESCPTRRAELPNSRKTRRSSCRQSALPLRFRPPSWWCTAPETTASGLSDLVGWCVTPLSKRCSCLFGFKVYNDLVGNGLSVILRCYQPVLISKLICNFKFTDCLGTNVNVRNSLDYLDVFKILTSSHCQKWRIPETLVIVGSSEFLLYYGIIF